MKKLNNEQIENLQGGVYASLKCAAAIMLTLESMDGGTIINMSGYADGMSGQATWCHGW